MLTITLYTICALGFLASLYALYVKIRKSGDKSYKAVCDINERISCTKAFSSKYSSLLLIPNATFGIPFYAIIAILTFMQRMDAIFLLAIIAVTGSVYLAYLSYIKLKVICPVCTLIYLLNIALLVLTSP